MPYRKPRLLKKRKLRTRRYKRYTQMRGSLMAYQPTFSETFYGGVIGATQTAGGAGGIFQVKFNQIPEYQNYVNLYNTYQIRSVQVLLIPTQPVNTQTGNPIDPPRITFAVQSTSDFATPTAELDVLNDNGCKIRLMQKPLKIRASMRPQLSVTDNTSSAAVAVTQTSKRSQWLSTSTKGTDVEHSGITWWCKQNYALAQASEINVYYKVFFAMRDPK